jgi:hypothetical protein
MLTKCYGDQTLSTILLSREQFKPFPTIEQREPWEHLPEELRNTVITQGETYLDFQWPFLPAVRYMDFARNGNRNRYEIPYFDRRFAVGALAVAECLEGQGRFLDDLINGIWGICEESSWVVPAHNKDTPNVPLPDITGPTIDLFAAETGALLSWVYYLLRCPLDQITPLICERIRHEIRLRILEPYLIYDDFWWMGLAQHDRPVNNWNPWCNSNCLTAFLLLEEDTERRIQAVAKCLKSLDRFLDGYHADGGCDEGTSYWGVAGGSLFDCLELLYMASQGQINVYAEPLIKNIGRYIYRAHIADDYFINFADGSAKINIYAELVHRYGCRIRDEHLSNLGATAFHQASGSMLTPGWYPMFRVLSYLMNYVHLKTISATPPYVKDVWLDGIQVMAVREQEGSCQGLYLAVKGGHNNESHNHNDVGQFLVYANGHPVIIDVGVETYTRKTFSPSRYEIWTMQSQYHNLPTVNGIQQHAGREFQASNVVYHADETRVAFSLNIATAYPDAAGIEIWKRTFRFQRNECASIEILDEFSLKSSTDNILLSLMTPCEHTLDHAGIILLHGNNGQNVQLEYDHTQLEASSEYIPIEDKRLRSVWGEHLHRILLLTKQSIRKTLWRITISQIIAKLS